MSELIVLDLLCPKPGKEADLAAALERVAAAEFAAAAAHGARSFTLRREQGGSRFMLEELWESRVAFDAFHAHHRPAELLAFLDHADELLTEPLQQVVSFWSSWKV